MAIGSFSFGSVFSVRGGAMRLAAATLGATLLSGCVYDQYGAYNGYGSGYGASNYRSSYYDCDPWAAWNSYYSCDYGSSFSNIGYSGGWYDDYYYPGYGTYIFDRAGSRNAMADRYRRYWSKKRYDYLRRGRNSYDRNERYRDNQWRNRSDYDDRYSRDDRYKRNKDEDKKRYQSDQRKYEGKRKADKKEADLQLPAKYVGKDKAERDKAARSQRKKEAERDTWYGRRVRGD